jgi:hypothetical protein
MLCYATLFILADSCCCCWLHYEILEGPSLIALPRDQADPCAADVGVRALAANALELSIGQFPHAEEGRISGAS